MFYYQDLVLEESELVYPPSEDSILLAERVDVTPGECVLDLGCGCGLIGILAAKRGAHVVCADINPYALELTKRNAERNGVRVTLVLSDLFSNLKDMVFDKIFFNPPYVPCEEEITEPIELSWNGGDDGNRVIERFLREFPEYLRDGGSAFIILSSMNNPEHLMEKYKNIHFELLTRIHMFFEDIMVYRLVVG